MPQMNIAESYLFGVGIWLKQNYLLPFFFFFYFWIDYKKLSAPYE
jgi:hypothetical protein